MTRTRGPVSGSYGGGGLAVVRSETSVMQNSYAVDLPRWKASWPGAAPSAGNVRFAVNGYVYVVSSLVSGTDACSNVVR